MLAVLAKTGDRVMKKPITLCDRCDIYMRCLLDDYDGKLCRKMRTVKPTNADYIRAMTDEELAEFLIEYRCVHKAPHCMEADCTQCWLGWLKQEVKECRY